MPEINIVAAAFIALSIAYLFIYPKFGGDDVKRLAWLDMGVGALVLAGLAPFYWSSSADFTFFVFDTSWWIFTILVYTLAELPLFYLYVKARGLGAAYRELFISSTSVMPIASRKSVERQLADTKWDGLRSSTSLRFLAVGANVILVAGALVLWQLEDSPWSALSLLYIAALGAFWFLLRQAVRLIPDAPHDSLDERMLRDRDSAYYSAYQGLAALVIASATALMTFAISQDLLGEGDGFNYQLHLTWTQVQALFWLTYGYALMLPSMAMAWRESRRQGSASIGQA